MRSATRQMRNFLATLFLSQGVPMLLGGDEIARTQRGNNNALLPGQRDLLDRLAARRARASAMLAFTRRLIELRSKHPVFHRADFTGEERMGSGAPDVWWFRADGRKMTQRNWRDGNALTLGVFLNGSEIPTHSAQGAPGDRRHLPDPVQRLGRGDRVHASGRLVRPPLDARALDRRGRSVEAGSDVHPARGVVPVEGRSLVVLRRVGWSGAMRATYRLQLGAGARLPRGSELVPYLRDLGVSHLVPLSVAAGALRARRTVRRRRSDAYLRGSGRRGEFRKLCSSGLGVVLDIVPNHMATGDENPFWRDPLWRAKFFDLDWRTGLHRRFFDVGGLAGVRMEDPEVWEVTHAKLVELAQEGADRRRARRSSRRARESAPLPRAAAQAGIERALGREDPRSRARSAGQSGRSKGRRATSS